MSNYITSIAGIAVVFLLLASAVSADTAFPVLLSPEQLAEYEDALSLVDVRSEAHFQAMRIPGAVSLPLGAFRVARGGVPGMLPAPDALNKLLSERGIRKERPVVVYGANSSPREVIGVARVFWALEAQGYPRVAILDGGLSRWVSENRETSSGVSEALPSAEEVVEAPEKRLALAEKSDVARTLEATNGAVLVDARPADHYSGAAPVRGLPRAGHIPGARNIPYSEVFTMPHAMFKAASELEPLLYADDITRDTEIIVYCNSGLFSSAIYFAYRLLGHERIANYDGGMFEWAADEALPVSTSAAP